MYNYFMNVYCIHVHVVEIMLKHPVELLVGKELTRVAKALTPCMVSEFVN